MTATSTVSTPSRLAACPRTLNCVSSQSSLPAQKVEPFRCEVSCDATLAELRKILGSMPGVSIVADAEGYLRAEFRSMILRFIDDLELLEDPAAQVIHVRSASRIGSWDFGANRKRVESLRKRLELARY